MYLLCQFFLAKHLKEVMLAEAIAFNNWVTLVNDYSITLSIDISTSTSSLQCVVEIDCKCICIGVEQCIFHVLQHSLILKVHIWT
jgi:hypothetical protein